MRPLRGIWAAVRARASVFIFLTVAILIVNLALPPLVLSAVRKPFDLFSFNPWLKNLPEWLRSDEATLGRKVEFVYNAALYWFIASGPSDAPEWGYTATVRDIVRMLFISGLFAAYFALWLRRRDEVRARPWSRRPQVGGVTGVLLSTFGVTTMPCSVIGCGAPVLPVLGLTVTGLTSGSLLLIYRVSQIATNGVVLLAAGAVLYLGWLVGGSESS